VHVPGRRDPEEDELKDGEVEIGMGIHNEPGSERKVTDLPGLVKTMLSHCLDTADKDRNFSQITDKDEVVLLVNNLGGVSPLELGGITNEVVEQLESGFKIKPVRILSGTFMTSLNGLGFSISLLKVADTGLSSGPSMLELLDAPAEASGWSAAISSGTWAKRGQLAEQEKQTDADEIQPSTLRGRWIPRNCQTTHMLISLQWILPWPSLHYRQRWNGSSRSNLTSRNTTQLLETATAALA
jgi:dihydroxyacetone kinase